jgi:hypothetical protein
MQGNEAWDADSGRRRSWHCEGLTMLIPIYDKLEDGAEVLWVDHTGRTVGRIRSLVKKKHELEAFDDNVEQE